MNDYPVGCHRYAFPSSLITIVQVNVWAGLGRENCVVKDETVFMKAKLVLLYVCVYIYMWISTYI